MIKKFIALALALSLVPGLMAQGPARDPKTGKFMKKDAKTASKKTAKKLPPRDPKTGRFMKKADAKMVKKGPARDPKTGRFIKKTDKKTDKKAGKKK
ncbi:MAG: hypothetical protein JSS72_05785 [Armatimonadetes bacterium]|nr:hypothetical protein [Armatimonadota bacterium]